MIVKNWKTVLTVIAAVVSFSACSGSGADIDSGISVRGSGANHTGAVEFTADMVDSQTIYCPRPSDNKWLRMAFLEGSMSITLEGWSHDDVTPYEIIDGTITAGSISLDLAEANATTWIITADEGGSESNCTAYLELSMTSDMFTSKRFSTEIESGGIVATIMLEFRDGRIITYHEDGTVLDDTMLYRIENGIIITTDEFGVDNNVYLIRMEDDSYRIWIKDERESMLLTPVSS